MVFQHFALFPHRNVIDNTAYGLKVQGVEKDERHEAAIEALAMVGLEAYAFNSTRELSGGMQQRVGLARALCTDPEVTGAVFYVMEFVDGRIAGEPIPEELGGPAASLRIAEEMLDALGALAAVDHEAAGIADLGRLEGFLERQVDRWRGQLESYQQREIPGVDEVTTWLAANRPSNTVPGIMHGDYNRHNMLFAPLVGQDAQTRLLAVLDWENATVGDPLMDLGYLLAGWDDADPRPADPCRGRGPVVGAFGSAARGAGVVRRHDHVQAGLHARGGVCAPVRGPDPRGQRVHRPTGARPDRPGPPPGGRGRRLVSADSRTGPTVGRCE